MKWLRWYRGTTENPKFAMIATLASNPGEMGADDRVYGAVTVTDVIAVWCALLEDAGNAAHWGVCRKDAKFIAVVLRWWPQEVQAVLDAMVQFEMISALPDGGYKIEKWANYQYVSDGDPTNAARQKRYRDAKKTLSSRPRNGPVTPPDLDTDKKEERKKEKIDTPSGSSIRTVLVLTPEREAVDIWNSFAERLGLPIARNVTNGRLAKMRKRLAECGGIDGWRAACEKIEVNAWMRGENSRGWKADLDFMLQEKTFTRLMEGSYDGKSGNSAEHENGFAAILAEAEQRSRSSRVSGGQ